MARKLRQLKEEGSPLAEDPRILEVDADIDRYAAVAAFTTSEGGKELRKAMRSDIAAAINELTTKYGKTDLGELLSIIAKLDSRISLLQALGNAKQNKEDAEKLLDELTS